MPLECGNDYSAKIIPRDINIWISRLFLGDSDGFSILYYQDVDSLIYWANQAAYRWKLRGMCMWSLGQEEMEDNAMKQIWSGIQIAFTAFGGFLGWFLGGVDGFLYALIAFTVIDYITGVMCAITDKNLSSSIGFKGICRKVLIFTLVGIGNIVDVYVLGQGGVLRTAVIFFYLSNEGVSILENSAHLGLPIPEKLKEVLEQLHERGGDDDESA